MGVHFSIICQQGGGLLEVFEFFPLKNWSGGGLLESRVAVKMIKGSVYGLSDFLNVFIILLVISWSPVYKFKEFLLQ
jgi:hypothetical protein